MSSISFYNIDWYIIYSIRLLIIYISYIINLSHFYRISIPIADTLILLELKLS